MTKTCRLFVHPRTFGTADLLINPKDFPNLKHGDVVEIYHPEEEYSRLLLQITTFKEDFQGKDTISVEQSIATAFQLRNYSDVYVNKVDPCTVSLDSVEVLFKDQYLGRSEMWRLKKTLVDSCVYLNKKIEFCGGTARVQVYEMWTQGERVACGVISDDTKIVFRSSTSMVYLFIQMSEEMWEFDIHGDLYFEKAVNGFLSDLFQKWKKHGSNHEVTLVLFSRAFYKASNLEEFPDYMRECLQKDYKGKFYEDFYRVIVQNERYDDWSGTLAVLRSLFSDYKKMISEYHKKAGHRVPAAFLSTAAQGNFLEVLNISLNGELISSALITLERWGETEIKEQSMRRTHQPSIHNFQNHKHYLERSLDRTGQLTVVISSGVGVFEVDRELANVTKQRIIDNGVGSDLVCVGEQPLHAVPLFKFHNKDSSITREDYSMPHWINLSFYSSGKKLAYSKFVPRIRLPPRRPKGASEAPSPINFVPKPKLATEYTTEDTNILIGAISNAGVDYDPYDAYDAQVFTLPPSHSASVQKTFGRTKKLSFCNDSKLVKWKMSDPDIYRSQLSSSLTSPPTIMRSSSIAISTPHSHSLANIPVASNSLIAPLDLERTRPSTEFFMDDDFSPPSHTTAVSSSSSSMSSSAPYAFQTTTSTSLQGSLTANSCLPPLVYPGRALVNPFDPSHVTIKMTSNRRRWTHVFPKGPTGVVIQQHHYQTSLENSDGEKRILGDAETGNGSDDSPLARSPSSADSRSRLHLRSYLMFGSPDSNLHISSKRTQALLWGVTGEQEWTPALTTGVDWKSLTIPACLPITTDYFPDELCLKTDYVFSDYNLLSDDINADYAKKRAIYRKPLTTKEVFLELISQRVAQGFQIVINSDSSTNSCGTSSVVIPKGSSGVYPVMEYKLSIGRIFHKVCLYGTGIRVTLYRPRHPYPPFVIHYRYRFQAPDHGTYGTSWVSFNAEKLENYNWNYLDQYICTRGDTDFALAESHKFWRCRLYAVPSNQPGTKKIVDGNLYCDVYTPITANEQNTLIDGFMKFIEVPINKIRRCTQQTCHKDNNMTFTSGQINRRRHSTGLVFLTRSQDKHVTSRTERPPLIRSGSKILEKPRISSTTDVLMPLTVTLDSDNIESARMMDLLRTSENVSNANIIEMMLHPHFGIEFLSKYPSLPSDTFVSYDAVRWLKSNVAGISTDFEAVKRLEAMRIEQFICHASGDKLHPFILGFYLYFIKRKNDSSKNSNKDKKERTDPINDLVTFVNEWAEIKITRIIPCETKIPLPFLKEFIQQDDCDFHPENWSVPLYKQRHIELDANNKSDRIEWGHTKYHSEYRVDRSFELVIEWMAASGSIVSDLIFSLVRKAQTYNLQLIPVPSDPHALPYALKSDPLRGPVFVPLDIESIMGNKSYLFEEFPEETWPKRLLLLQETIAFKFGFLGCSVDKGSSHHNQYVHLTGNVFLLIASPFGEQEMQASTLHSKSTSLNVKGVKNRILATADEIAVSPHQEYISRHVTDMQNDNVKPDNRIGYLWSWNHMVGRRWKCSNLACATGDEPFQDKLLLDFRQFCSNNCNRLKIFWDTCVKLKADEALQTQVH